MYMKFKIKPLNIKVESMGGLIHILLTPILVILALFNKRFLTIFLVYLEAEALSWGVFRNECLIGLGYRMAQDPGHHIGQQIEESHFFAPQYLHNIVYAARVYLFSKMSTILNTLAYALLLVPQVYKKSKVSKILKTNWSYLTIPFILYIFNNKNGPLSMQYIRENPAIPTYGVYIAAAYLLYNFAITGFANRLPMAVGFALLAFIYGSIWHSEPAQNTA